MKKAIITTLGFLLLAALFLAGCGASLTGSGNLKTEEHTFSGFTNVDVSSAFEFSIIKGDSYGVSVTVDDNVLEKLRVTKDGDTLKIDFKAGVFVGRVTLEAVVTMPQLRGLTVSGASHGTVSGFSSAENLAFDLSGASTVTGDITVGDAAFELSGASTVELEGSATNLVANASGASHLKLGDYVVTNADVTLSGSSDGTVSLSGRLDADLSGSAKLSYIGEPSMGNIDTSGSSKIGKQ